MHQNSIMVVKPYKWEGMWVFDDEKTGLVREPFVAGVPEILEALLEQQGIPVEEAEKGFRLIFSAIPFPGHQLSARRVGKREAATGMRNRSARLGVGCAPLCFGTSTRPRTTFMSVSSVAHKTLDPQ